MSDPKSPRVTPFALAIILILLITNAVTLGFLLKEKYYFNEEEYYQSCQEEIDNLKNFVNDWYYEMSSANGKASVYKNEIRFDDGRFVLTVSANRIRAVYPRGERFFRLNNINYVEFYEENNRVLCRIFYGNGGEFVFRVQ
ncbi:MAG: hypothetical protein K6G89_05200 [Clostridia bacterium]|nr:hypothetical protein [Clostridia bacterium]